MPRLPRRLQWTGEACYHVMNRGHNREAIFCDDEDHLMFLNLVARYRERFHFRVFHYCLMSNHFHLLLQLDDSRALSPMMAGLLRAYVHHCHRRYGFVGHRWQGRYKSPAVQCRHYLLSCGRYSEWNPVAAGVEVEPWKYRWSSARTHALGETDQLLTESHEDLALSADAEQRQALWRDFLMGHDPREEAMRRGDWVIGDEQFRRSLLERHGRAAPRRRGRPAGASRRIPP